MIPSIARGGNMGGLLAYLAGPGRAEEHVNPRLIAGSADVVLLAEPGPVDANRARELARMLDAPHQRWGTISPVAVKDRETGERTGTRDGHVWHCSLALPAGERLEDAGWGQIAGRYVELMKLDGCRWAVIRHGESKAGNDHAHLVIDLIRPETGKSASVHRDQSRAQAACARLAKTYRLEQVAGQQQHVDRDEHRQAAAAKRVIPPVRPAEPAATSSMPESEPVMPPGQLVGRDLSLSKAPPDAAAAPTTPPVEPSRPGSGAVVPARPLVGRRLRLAKALREAVGTATTPRELVEALRARGVLSRWTRRPGGKIDGLVVWERIRRRGERRVYERAGQLDRALALPRLVRTLKANARAKAAREAMMKPGAAIRHRPPGARIDRGPGPGRDFGR